MVPVLDVGRRMGPWHRPAAPPPGSRPARRRRPRRGRHRGSSACALPSTSSRGGASGVVGSSRRWYRRRPTTSSPGSRVGRRGGRTRWRRAAGATRSGGTWRRSTGWRNAGVVGGQRMPGGWRRRCRVWTTPSRPGVASGGLGPTSRANGADSSTWLIEGWHLAASLGTRDFTAPPFFRYGSGKDTLTLQGSTPLQFSYRTCWQTTAILLAVPSTALRRLVGLVSGSS